MKTKLHPDVLAIRKAAPKGADAVGHGSCGLLWFQKGIQGGQGLDFWCATNLTGMEEPLCTKMRHSFAVNLETGSVWVIDDTTGKPVKVPQSAWVAARERKAGKGKRG